ncbi:DUF4355 domain-containing protein [Vagococcus carniphilus]|uniref:DUF4355 domain-containing protein n=1 Tax=Vagococcus carniphilus TaxID=218144 RepID=UPI00288FD6C4|nr:DUF4355 domain-containing protein [Vagococcus carniphilus]MDT2864687.1 DUF4355 domain-containing protein [Vagococcus carniphilus]
MKFNLLPFFEADTGSNGQDTPADTKDQENVEVNKEQQPEKTFTRAELAKMMAAEKAKLKEEFEAEKAESEKLAKMNEQEKLQHQLDQQAEKLAEYERKETLSKMSETASEMLTEKGVTASKEVLSLLVSEDAETTSSNVKAYLTVIEAERELIKADFEKRLGTKIPLGGNTEAELSRGVQIAKLQNERQKSTTIDEWD